MDAAIVNQYSHILFRSKDYRWIVSHLDGFDSDSVGIPMTSVYSSWMNEALSSGCFEIAKILLQRGALFTENSLMFALPSGDFDCVNLVLSSRTKLTYKEQTTVARFIANRSNLLFAKHIVECMKEMNLDYISVINLALPDACLCGNYRGVEYFLENGADVTSKLVENLSVGDDYTNMSSINLASRNWTSVWPREMIVKLLLDYGADHTELDLRYATPDMLEYVPVNPRRVYCCMN